MALTLIVDDDADAAEMLAAQLAQRGHAVMTAHSLRDARRQIAVQPPELVLLDLRLPDGHGLALFEEPALAQASVVLMTGYATLETAVQALRLGALDYLVKPVTAEQLGAVLQRVLPAAEAPGPSDWNAQLASSGRFGHLVGRAPCMQHVYRQIARVAQTGVTVLVMGESGTGKELVARTLHDESRRRERPFLAVNCGAISPQLMESEIFGHEKGSFTGADRQHQGFSSAPMAAPCSWTKSPRCRWSCRSSCCACWRPAASCAWARRSCTRPTCASWPRPTAIPGRRSNRAACAKTCCTGSMCSPWRCRRCVTASKTWNCFARIS